MSGEAKMLVVRRAATHGEFRRTASVAQGIKRALRATAPSARKGLQTDWQALPPELREALDAMAVKMARIVCGDERVEDHWRDIQGYAELALEWIQRERA